MNFNLTPEAAAQLQGGINLLVSRWPALRIAVENEWGGRDSAQKPQQLSGSIFHLLINSKEKVYIEDLYEMLEEFMDTLYTGVEDGSLEEVAEQIMIMHEECAEGNFDSIRKLRETNTPKLAYVRKGSNDEEDSEDDDDDTLRENNSSEMEIDAPQCQSSPSQRDSLTDHTNVRATPEVEDGWTVVSSRRSKGRKN